MQLKVEHAVPESPWIADTASMRRVKREFRLRLASPMMVKGTSVCPRDGLPGNRKALLAFLDSFVAAWIPFGDHPLRLERH